MNIGSALDHEILAREVGVLLQGAQIFVEEFANQNCAPSGLNPGGVFCLLTKNVVGELGNRKTEPRNDTKQH